MLQLNVKNYCDCLTDNYVLILTANSNEKKAVNKLIQHRQSIALGHNTHGSYIGIINDHFVIHICGTSGIGDSLSISRIVMHLLGQEHFPRPKLLLLVGICWGDPNKTSVGDGIICNSVFSLNRTDEYPSKTDYRAKQYISTVFADEALVDGICDQGSRFTLGALASLEKLLMSDRVREEVLRSAPSAIGGEMEAFGLMPSLSRIPWLIIKAVSDCAGDNFSRDSQIDVLQAIISRVPSVLQRVVEANDMNFKMRDEVAQLLHYVLIGDTFVISRSEVSADGLNDFLNDNFGPIFIYKLQRYCSGIEYDSEFPYSFCDLLLELVQNSFRHGGAEKVTISFNSKSIVVVESIDAYDLQSILGNQGGAKAWQKVKLQYLDSQQISYKVKSQRHLFSLNKIDSVLRETVANCSAAIVQKSVRSGYKSCTLEVDSSCEAVYVDARGIFMSSRSLEVITDINTFLKDGRIVYVACRNKQQVLEYKESIKGESDNARVFVS